MKKLKLLFLVFILSIAIFFPFKIYAQDISIVANDQPAGIPQLQQLFKNALNAVVALAFIAVTGVLVWAGIKLMTSGGDQKQIQSAYDMITWAVLGIFFLAIAWLVLLLIQNFTGVQVTQFCLGFDCQPTTAP